MKVRFTEGAVRDLDEVLAYTARHFLASAPALEERLREAIQRIAEWPASAPRVDQRSDTRAVFLGRCPYKVFYRVMGDEIEVLHIHHAAERPARS